MAAEPIPLFRDQDYVYLRSQQYEVERLIGFGGFGVVVKADRIPPTDPRTSHAIKAVRFDVTDKARYRSLLREAHFGRVVRHFHCANSLARFSQHGMFYIVMDYYPGGSLASYLVKHRHPSSGRVQQFVKEIASGLHYLHHDVKIAHRDVKLDNILLDGHRRIKLCDFGFAKDQQRTTLRNTNIGADPCKPPELFVRRLYVLPQGHPECDPMKHDVWGLGVVAFQMLTEGHFPFVLEELERWPLICRRLDIEVPMARVKDRHPDVQQVLRQALTINFENRPTICDLMQMPWLSGYVAPPPPPRPEP